MSFPLTLPQADHELLDRVAGWFVDFVDTNPPTVKLIASIESGPRQTTAPTQGQTATSLALHMDSQAALDLYKRLGEIAETMGWLLPPQSSGSTGAPKSVPLARERFPKRR